MQREGGEGERGRNRERIERGGGKKECCRYS